jgi:hypothetical protein
MDTIACGRVLSRLSHYAQSLCISYEHKKTYRGFTMDTIEKIWHSAQVFTKAPGFGPGVEIMEGFITIRPDETKYMALKREGFDPSKSRAEIVTF